MIRNTPSILGGDVWLIKEKGHAAAHNEEEVQTNARTHVARLFHNIRHFNEDNLST